MLAAVVDKSRDEVYATSLLRLLATCPDQKKWPVLIVALRDPSPLVRSAAAAGLQDYHTSESVKALLKATRDEYRLVRIRAAASLASIPPERFPEPECSGFKAALTELESSLAAWPDDSASHYNPGNYHMRLMNWEKAASCFEISVKLRPDAVVPHVNASIAYANMGDTKRAEGSLRKALAIAPQNAAANLNLGLLLANRDRCGRRRQPSGLPSRLTLRCLKRRTTFA
jgi:tetratricopeptide (TPR) repeat protein